MLLHFQATDVPEYECDLPAVNKETAGNEERLMDSKGKPSPDVVEPIGEDRSFTRRYAVLDIFLKP